MPEEYVTAMPCPNCEEPIKTPHDGGFWVDSDELTCNVCKATCVVSTSDEPGEPVTVYFVTWKCTHGRADYEECVACDAEGRTRGG